MKRYLGPLVHNKGKYKPPMRSFEELADEFGVSTGSLQQYIAHHPQGAPKGLRTGSGPTYYNHAEARAWWKGVQK